MQFRRLAIHGAIAGSLLASSALQAQTAAPAGSIDEVVVTATKREEKLHDVAMSITAISGDDLTNRQESSFLDFAAHVPGLSFEAIDPSRNRVILRGQNVGSVGATVATAIDDIPFFMSGAQADGTFFSANIDTFDMKRIEVLRGPQGTLYGAAAEGGLLKYVTNLPNLTTYEGSLVVGGGAIQGGDYAGFAKGMVNIPFWDNKAAFRFSAVDEGIPGYIDNPLTGQKNDNHGGKMSFRGSVLFKPTDELTIRLTGFSQSLSVRGDNSVEVVGAAADPAHPAANQFTPVNGLQGSVAAPHVIKDQMSYYALNVQYEFKPATLTSMTSYGRIREHYTNDLSNTNVAPGLTYGIFIGELIYGLPAPAIIAGDQVEKLGKFNQEVRLSSNPGTTLFGHDFDWQGGGFFTHETTLLHQPINAYVATDLSTPIAPALGGADIPGDYRETAFFADFTYHFSKVFDVEVGGRTTKIEQNSQVRLHCCVLYGPEFAFAPIFSDESAQTWSVAPRFHLGDNTLLYGRVATGFRPGGPNLPTPTLPDPPSFKPDRTTNYEIGIRTDLFDKKLTIDFDVFAIKWKDVQILSLVQTSTGPVGINGNAGKAVSKGIEWNFSWRPTTGLAFGFLGAYTNAKLSADAPLLNAFSGDKLPFVPDISGTLDINYNWKTFGTYSAFVDGSWTYTGSRYTGFSPSVTVVEPHVKLPTYNTFRLAVGVDNGKYSAQLYAENLSNERGITEYGNNGGSNQTGQVAFIQPRTIGVQLGAKF